MRRGHIGLRAVIFAGILFAGHGTQAQTTLVVGPGDYATIPLAIADAVDGDTVLVSRGTYDKNFTPKPGVTIQGEETAETFLTGDAVLAQNGAGGTLERFTIRGGWKFRNAQDLVLRNCVITGSAGIAIEVEDSPDTIISNNVFYDNATALKISNVIGSTSSGSVLANAFVDNATAMNVPPNDVTKDFNLFANNPPPQNTGDNSIVAADTFAADGFVDAAGGDFHLVEIGGADCIDLVPAETLADPDGTGADCGAYGGPAADTNPRQVTNLVVSAGAAQNSADLTWTADTNYLVTGYRLHYGKASGVYDGTGAAEGSSPVPVTGGGTASGTLSDLTVTSTPPPAPTGLAAGPAGTGSIFLSWDAAAGATGYTVLYGTQRGVYTQEQPAGDSTTATVDGLTNGVTYYVAVRPYTENTYYLAVSATGTTAEGAAAPPEGQLSAEASLEFDKTQGDPSAEVSVTPSTISGYPDLDDGGFCFLRSLHPLPVPTGTRLTAGLLGALLLSLAVTAARLWGCRRLLTVVLGIALAGAAGSARAASPRWSLDARAGAFWPSDGDWDDNYDHGILPEVKLGAGYRLTRYFELGAEAGYRKADGTVDSSDDGRPLAQSLDQTLTVVPLQGYALVRLQSSDDQLLVPYLAAGLTSYLYWHEVDGDQDARGRQDGYHARGGVYLSLQQFEPTRADRNRRNYGLLGSGITLEVQYARVDDFGSADTDLGGWSLFGGLSLQF